MYVQWVHSFSLPLFSDLSFPITLLSQVNAMMVVKTIQQNGDRAKRLLLTLVPMIAAQDWTETIQKNRELIQTSVMLP